MNTSIVLWAAAFVTATVAAGQGQEAPATGLGWGAHDRTAPIEVSADTLEVDQATGKAFLEGNVVILQGALRVLAPKVEIDPARPESGQQIKRFVARGGVRVVSGGDTAESGSVAYDVVSGMLEMRENVLLTQGGNTLSGDLLVIDLDTGAGTMSGRVRTVLGAPTR